jgi:hypothetical protein
MDLSSLLVFVPFSSRAGRGFSLFVFYHKLPRAYNMPPHFFWALKKDALSAIL